LKEKHRDGAKVIKRYHRPATPYQRLLADPRTPEEIRGQLTALSLTLDPVLLLRDMCLAQERLVTTADTPGGPVVANDAALPLEAFLEGLRISWRGGEIRPTPRATPAAKRERRRPDPLLAVSIRPSRGGRRESSWSECRRNIRDATLTA
jgi:hypothetical protein